MLNILLAQEKIGNPALSDELQAFSGIEFFNALVPNLITLLFIAAVVVALVFLIIGAIKWITSGGDKTAVESARGTITSAIIGLVVVFSVYAILRLIGYFFHLELLEFDLEPLKLLS